MSSIDKEKLRNNNKYLFGYLDTLIVAEIKTLSSYFKKIFYLVKWKDYSLKESTWEEEKQLKEDLGEPHFKKLVDLMKK